MSHPGVTVLMPVYNAATHLKAAVDSILNQTLSDFEFLIINDGSTDESGKILREYAQKDRRITLIEQENKGLIDTLNYGIEQSTGEYIARMDADDVAYPERLERQCDFLNRNKSIGACGTWIRALNHPSFNIIKYYKNHEDICMHMFKLVAFAHPTVMMRRDVLAANNIKYNKNFKHAEDYEFWRELASITRLANLPEVLLDYRFHPNQVSSTHKSTQVDNAKKARMAILEHLLQRKISDEEYLMHKFITHNGKLMKTDLHSYKNWIEEIYRAGLKRGGYHEVHFKEMLTRGYYKVLLEFTRDHNKLLSHLKQMPFYSGNVLSKNQKIRLFAKSLLNK